ncbi:MAG TPA: hypothetical protein VGM38_09010 [Pseudolysinimonas sp.]
MSTIVGTGGASMPAFDSGALRAALEKQQSDLAPIARVLAAAAAFPPQFSPDDWRGEAAESCLRLQDDLRRALLASDHALAAAERSTRSALTELGA